MAFKTLIRLAAAGSCAALMLSGPALAQDKKNDGMKNGGTPHLSRTFRLLDTNGNGKVSLDEIKAEQARLIGAADLDGDGKLSVDEFRRRGWWFQKLHTSTLFDLMDANGDQVLSADEIANPSARWFKRYDKDADGGITADEVPHFKRSRGYHKRK